jgi:hypothetical protein
MNVYRMVEFIDMLLDGGNGINAMDPVAVIPYQEVKGKGNCHPDQCPGDRLFKQ